MLAWMPAIPAGMTRFAFSLSLGEGKIMDDFVRITGQLPLYN